MYSGQQNTIIQDKTVKQPLTELNTLVTDSSLNPNDETPDYMYALNANDQIRMNPEISTPYTFVPATPVIVAGQYQSTGK